MTTATAGDGGQAPTTSTPGEAQAATGQQDQQPAAGPQAGSQAEALTDETPLDSIPESIRGYVAKLRQEAASQRATARQASEQVQQYQRERETDAERVQREATEAQERLTTLEQENRELKVTYAITAAASTAGAFNPARVAALLDKDVQVDDKGQPVNVAEALAALQASDPYLFKRATLGADAGAGAGQQASPTGGGINDLIRGNAHSRGAR